MEKYQTYCNFSAQNKTISALFELYEHIERNDSKNFELPIVVFIAFSIESYLNSLGSRHSNIWGNLERLPWKDKIEILHKISEKPLNWGEDPLQFVSEIFKLRDKLAHGKPENILGPCTKDIEAAKKILATNQIQPEWYIKITHEWLLKAKIRFHKLMCYLANLFDLHENDHLLSSESGVRVEIPLTEFKISE
jgi:hypothetical protein